MARRWLAIAAVVVGGVASAVLAAEMTTDAERTYRELRRSNDAKTKAMAERWYGAIRLQEWTDATGKFKTTAKYVEHDPALAWVKLRVIQGTGDKRIVKDITVPVEKLSPTSRARVALIKNLAARVAEAAAAEKESAENAEGGAGEMADGRAMEGDPRGGRGGYEAGLAGMDPEQALAQGGDPRDPRQAADPRQMSDPRMSPPAENPASPEPVSLGGGAGLPAMLPPLPSDRPQLAAAPAPTEDPRYGAQYAAEAAAPVEPASPMQPAAPPSFPDNDPWRTDYEAFRANFERDADGVIATKEQWPGVVRMQELTVRAESYYEQLVGRAGGMTPTSFLPMAELEEVGEFQWEATVAQPVGGEANWTDVLALPPLPEPLRIELRLDDERGAGAWQQLQVGDRVRFIGRLIGFAGHTVWVAAVRFPDPSQSAAPALPASDYASPPADPRGR